MEYPFRQILTAKKCCHARRRLFFKCHADQLDRRQRDTLDEIVMQQDNVS